MKATCQQNHDEEKYWQADIHDEVLHERSSNVDVQAIGPCGFRVEYTGGVWGEEDGGNAGEREEGYVAFHFVRFLFLFFYF